jgi:HlyD family secretion protein
MKRIVPLLAVVGVLAVAVVGVRLIAHRKAAEGILGSGLIEADEVQVSAKIGGRLAQMLVREGDEVKSGQLVAVLEHADIDADIERARGALAAADAAAREMQRGSRVEQIEGARARLAQAGANRQGAERQLHTAQEAYAKVTELKQQLDSAKARVRVADTGVTSAQARLDEAAVGLTRQEIDAQRAVVAQAEARVETARVAAQNAEQVYQHQVVVEGPLIAATTEASADEANDGLAQRELDRTEALAKEDAATGRALDQTRAQRAVSGVKLAGARRAVTDAGEQVAVARAQAKQMLDTAQHTLQEAMRARDAAQAQLDVALAGTREERLRLATAALSSAQAEADAARTVLKSATELYEDRLPARQQRDAAQAALDSARALERAGQAELSLLIAGQTQEAIQSALGRVAEARGALKLAEVRRGYCEVLAPRAGTITEAVAKEGETVAAGAPVAILTDVENLRLRAYLGFATLGKVREGDTLQVTTEAVPGRVFTGRVVRISEEAEFTPKDVQTPEQRIKQVYWVKVWLGNGDRLLKPGMPADVRGEGTGDR